MAPMPEVERIRQVCHACDGLGFYTGEIPARKETNARARYDIPAHEELVALVDNTVFGSARRGIAICAGGIHWKGFILPPQHFSWRELRSVTFEIRSSEVQFSDGKRMLPVGLPTKDLHALLCTLKELAIEARAGEDRLETAAAPLPGQTTPNTGGTPPSSTRRTESLTDLNTASLDELVALPGFSRQRAELVLRVRRIQGRFSTVREVAELLGLEPHMTRRLQDHAMVRLGPSANTVPPAAPGGRKVDY